MKRWSPSAEQKVENTKVDAFLAEIWAVCERHGMALSHEDGNGAFEVVSIGDPGCDWRAWLMEAHDLTESGRR